MGEIGQVPNHQVKVDNWPLFFLQRLHHFYRKKTHCDLTLLFSTIDTVKSIKVHKLVLHACTDYFESLDIMKDSEHGEVLQLSNEMHPDVVIPIISFMYTGKLEFPVTLQPRLYEAATKLRMTILTKLLDVQPNKTQRKVSNLSTEEPKTKISMPQKEISVLEANTADQDVRNLGSPSVEHFSSPSSSKQIEDPIITLTPVTVVSNQQKQNVKPEVSFIQEVASINLNNQVRAKVIKKNLGLQLAAVNTKAKVVDVNLPPTLPGRKLPVWKRKVPLGGSQFVSDNVQSVRSPLRPAELPTPTRFEWDEDLNDPTQLKPVEDALKILSHDGTVKITHPIVLEPETTSQAKETSDDSLKRSSDGSSPESPPYKRSRQSDLQDMKEYGKQQQLRNEIICSEENEDDILDTDDIYSHCEDESDDLTNSSTPKPILKSISKPELPPASKRVRFSLEGKENNQQQEEAVADFTSTVKAPETASTTQKIVLPVNIGQLQSGKHHVKIVSEVFKKYPNLAKRENIKLRVVSKNPAAVPAVVQQAVEGDAGGGSKSSSSLVSYIFLTNKSSGELLPVKGEQSDKDKLFDVENKTGPWFCQVCNEESPLEFESYYTYRRHLVEVHELKIDARICEYCGLKNSKRNHLLYHLYTKHGIDPPAHISFPKCSECDYIALSDALLVKHKRCHDPKELTCYTCNLVFKSYSSMQIHLQSSCHKSKLNESSVVVVTYYPCPFCDARFDSGNELKDHFEGSHHSQRISQAEGKQIYRCPYCEATFGDGDSLGQHIVFLHWGKNKRVQGSKAEASKSQSGQQMTEEVENSNTDGGENQILPSQESLDNVTTGLPTLINPICNEQTLVYCEQRTEGQDIGREATVVAGNECKDYIIATTLDVDEQQCQAVSEGDMENIIIENEDSNSRTSNLEEVNRSSCSDHDYSEPQGEDEIRQIIPLHSVTNQIPETTVIQQIMPDQRLVFSNQGSVVFHSACVGLPSRVLLAPGKMVIPRVSAGDQNVILSQVIPQAPIILSSPILQQSGNIIEDGSGTIVFANAESAEHLENVQVAMQYPLQNAETVEISEADKAYVETPVIGEQEIGEGEEKGIGGDEEEEEEEEEDEEEEEEEESKTGEERENEGDKVETVESEEKVNDISNDDNSVENSVRNLPVSEKTVEEENCSVPAPAEEEPKTQIRVETAKIVDDWDEANDSQLNVESRSDGPSRPDFF